MRQQNGMTTNDSHTLHAHWNFHKPRLQIKSLLASLLTQKPMEVSLLILTELAAATNALQHLQIRHQLRIAATPLDVVQCVHSVLPRQVHACRLDLH